MVIDKILLNKKLGGQMDCWPQKSVSVIHMQGIDLLSPKLAATVLNVM